MISQNQWKDVRDIYMDIFPKTERRPFFLLKNAVRRDLSEVWVASDECVVLGFVVLIQHMDIVLVEYIALSDEIAKGLWEEILLKICREYEDKRIVVQLDEINGMTNDIGRKIEKKRFCLANGFLPSVLFVQSIDGNMEILSLGGRISGDEFIALKIYALGRIKFVLSKMRVVSDENGRC